MQYVKHILLPGERALIGARVHPVLLAPGLALALLSLAFLAYYQSWFGQTYATAKSAWWLYNNIDFIPMRRLLRAIIEWGRAPGADAKLLILLPLLYGIKRFMEGLMLMLYTELVITDRRIIAKIGIMTITTVEIDRRRIAGVTVHQSFWGRILNYGTIYLQGFAGGIGGLPVIIAPHRIQAYVNAGYA